MSKIFGKSCVRESKRGIRVPRLSQPEELASISRIRCPFQGVAYLQNKSNDEYRVNDKRWYERFDSATITCQKHCIINSANKRPVEVAWQMPLYLPMDSPRLSPMNLTVDCQGSISMSLSVSHGAEYSDPFPPSAMST